MASVTRMKIAEFFLLVALVTDLQTSSASICSLSHESLTASNGSLKSPNFPNNYPHNTTKVWKVTAPVGQKITLQFHTLRLEAHSAHCKVKCGCDYVKVRNNCSDETPVYTLCGAVHPLIVTSAGSELWVEFRSDHSVNESGFLALYTRASMSCPHPSDSPAKSDYCLQNGRVECCDRDYVACKYNKLLTNLNGTIRSPGYPSHYAPNTTFKWRVTVPQGYVVQINFTEFEVEGSSGGCSKCACDKMSISNGPCEFYEGFSACGKYGEVQLRKLSYVSKSRHLFVTFKSNGLFNYKGFEAHYRIALQCSGQKPFSCVANGNPSCCSHEKVAVTCSDRHLKSHCKLGQVCCTVNGIGQCCSRQDASVTCSDKGSAQRSHCPENKECCILLFKPMCCFKTCSDSRSSQRSHCPSSKVCCIVNGKGQCCSLQDASTRCTDSGSTQRSHCPASKDLCCFDQNLNKPMCCSEKDMKSWSLMITVLAVMLVLLQYPNGLTNN